MRRAKVGDVLQFQRRKIEIDPAKKYTLIGIYSFGRGIFHRDPQLGIDLGNYTYSSVLPGDLVLSNIGAWEGGIGFATEAELDTVGSNRFLSYTSRDPDDVDTNWVRYFLLSSVGFPLVQKAAPGSVARNRTLARGRFEGIEIPLPHINEQRRIASHLDRVAAVSMSVEQRRRVARTRSEALHASMASQPQLSERERKAAGWRVFSLSQLMAQSGEMVEVKVDAQYPNLGIYSFGRGVFDKPPINGMETSAKKLNCVRSGQFIYSRLFAFEGAYAHVPDEYDRYFVSNEFPSFDVDPDLAEAEFIAAALRSPRQWKALSDMSKGLGVRRQRVQVEALLAHELWVPPISEQHRILNGLEKLNQVNKLMTEADDLASAIVPSALNRAFAGLE